MQSTQGEKGDVLIIRSNSELQPKNQHDQTGARKRRSPKKN